MLKISVDEAPAGPAMDAAVAIMLGLGDVFRDDSGWYVASDKAAFRRARETDSYVFEQEGHFCYPLAAYSTDIAAAWELEESLEVDQQSDYVVALFNLVTTDLGSPDFLTFSKAAYWRMVHASPLDRCRAFLKANGVEHVEVPE